MHDNIPGAFARPPLEKSNPWKNKRCPHSSCGTSRGTLCQCTLLTYRRPQCTGPLARLWRVQPPEKFQVSGIINSTVYHYNQVNHRSPVSKSWFACSFQWDTDESDSPMVKRRFFRIIRRSGTFKFCNM